MQLPWDSVSPEKTFWTCQGAKEKRKRTFGYVKWCYFFFKLRLGEGGVNPCPNGKSLGTKHDQTLFCDQTCWCTKLPNGINRIWSPSKRAKCFTVFANQMSTKSTSKFYQTRSNTIKQGVKLNGKMFGHQTIFDPVVSANISRLDRALSSHLLACYFGLTHV